MNRFYYIFCLSISLKVIENLTKGHPVFFFKCIVITTIRRVDIIIIDSFRKFEVLINLDVLQRNQKTALHNINNQNTIHVCNKNMKSQIKCKAEFSTNETERKKKKKKPENKIVTQYPFPIVHSNTESVETFLR